MIKSSIDSYLTRISDGIRSNPNTLITDRKSFELTDEEFEILKYGL